MMGILPSILIGSIACILTFICCMLIRGVDIDIRELLGISKEVHPGYQNIRVTFYVKSDAPSEKLEELVKFTQMRSPVFYTVSQPVTVNVGLEIAEPVAKSIIIQGSSGN